MAATFGPGGPRKTTVLVSRPGKYAMGSHAFTEQMEMVQRMKAEATAAGDPRVRDPGNEISHLGDKRVKVPRKNMVVGGSKRQVRLSKRPVKRSPQAAAAAKRLEY